MWWYYLGWFSPYIAIRVQTIRASHIKLHLINSYGPTEMAYIHGTFTCTIRNPCGYIGTRCLNTLWALDIMIWRRFPHYLLFVSGILLVSPPFLWYYFLLFSFAQFLLFHNFCHHLISDYMKWLSWFIFGIKTSSEPMRIYYQLVFKKKKISERNHFSNRHYWPFAGSNPLVVGGFPAQKASKANSVSMTWHLHDGCPVSCALAIMSWLVCIGFGRVFSDYILSVLWL